MGRTHLLTRGKHFQIKYLKKKPNIYITMTCYYAEFICAPDWKCRQFSTGRIRTPNRCARLTRRWNAQANVANTDIRFSRFQAWTEREQAIGNGAGNGTCSQLEQGWVNEMEMRDEPRLVTRLGELCHLVTSFRANPTQLIGCAADERANASHFRRLLTNTAR